MVNVLLLVVYPPPLLLLSWDIYLGHLVQTKRTISLKRLDELQGVVKKTTMK